MWPFDKKTWRCFDKGQVATHVTCLLGWGDGRLHLGGAGQGRAVCKDGTHALDCQEPSNRTQQNIKQHELYITLGTCVICTRVWYKQCMRLQERKRLFDAHSMQSWLLVRMFNVPNLSTSATCCHVVSFCDIGVTRSCVINIISSNMHVQTITICGDYQWLRVSKQAVIAPAIVNR